MLNKISEGASLNRYKAKAVEQIKAKVFPQNDWL